MRSPGRIHFPFRIPGIRRQEHRRLGELDSLVTRFLTLLGGDYKNIIIYNDRNGQLVITVSGAGTTPDTINTFLNKIKFSGSTVEFSSLSVPTLFDFGSSLSFVRLPKLVLGRDAQTLTGDDETVDIDGAGTSGYVALDAGGTARVGTRLEAATYTGQVVVIANVGGENVKWHETDATSRIAGAATILPLGPDQVQVFIWDDTASRWEPHASAGSVHPLANTYSGDASGTAGADATAQTVKTIVIPANSITQAGDRVRVRVYWTGTTGANITGTLTVNGVTIGSASDVGAAAFFTTQAWLHYVDNTHATIIETGAYPATGAASAANVAGFTWDADQDVDLDQDSAVNNHIIVYFLAVDVFPKGVA